MLPEHPAKNSASNHYGNDNDGKENCYANQPTAHIPSPFRENLYRESVLSLPVAKNKSAIRCLPASSQIVDRGKSLRDVAEITRSISIPIASHNICEQTRI
jgi:hypothetical protein